eukprot:EG_transcript_6229
MSRKTVDLCRQLLNTISEATGAQDDWINVQIELSIPDTKEQRVCWAGTPKSRMSMGSSPRALTTYPNRTVSFQATPLYPKTPTEVQREEAVLFHQKCVELARDPAYKKRCWGYARRIAEHAEYVKREVEPRIQERQARVLEKARQRDLMYSWAMQLAETQLLAKRSSIEAKEARARALQVRRWPVGSREEVWRVMLVQALVAGQFPGLVADLRWRSTLTEYLPSQETWSPPSPMRRKAAVCLIQVFRTCRSLTRVRPVQHAIHELLRRVRRLQCWVRSCLQCRLATLDVLRMQWTAVMAKLQEDSKAMLQQRYETRVRNAIYWAEVELDTADFHFPDLRWPKIVQRKLLDQHTDMDVPGVFLTGVPESSTNTPSVASGLGASPAATLKQGEASKAPAVNGTISSHLQQLLEEGDRSSRRRRAVELRASVQQQRLRMLDLLDAMTARPDEADLFFVPPAHRVECITSEYHRRRHAFYLAYREWLRMQRASLLRLPLPTRPAESTSAAIASPPKEPLHVSFAIPTTKCPEVTLPDRSRSAPAVSPPLSLDAEVLGVRVAACTGRPIRRPPMFPRRWTRKRSPPSPAPPPAEPPDQAESFAASECPPPRPPSPPCRTASSPPSSPRPGSGTPQ